MAAYFSFELEAVAKRCLYLSLLEDTDTAFHVSAVIEAFRHGIETRPRRLIPH